MAVKPRAHCGQITACQLRQRHVHGVRSLLLLVSRCASVLPIVMCWATPSFRATCFA
jgi:hypothetical protein